MSRLRIVLVDGALADYPHGGGHWSALLQHLFGLDDLGHDVFWLEFLRSSGRPAQDQRQINVFLRRFERYGYRNRCAVLVHQLPIEETTLAAMEPYGQSAVAIREMIETADLAWNFCATVRQPLLGLFRRRALIDLDPGILQAAGLRWGMGLSDHEVLFTVGLKLHDADCAVPTLGRQWHRFLPLIHLPHWPVVPAPQPEAPFTSVTQWTWSGGVELGGRLLSVSKRDTYLRYRELPRRAGRPLELAVNIHPQDATGDRELLLENGWRLVHPHKVARRPIDYQRYIQRSRAEFACLKPVYREARTGWFSDRSAAYLASGRPVLTEDTGFSDHVPTGNGLITFNSMQEAVNGIERIDTDYARHSRAAREWAEEFLDARKCLRTMLDACG